MFSRQGSDRELVLEGLRAGQYDMSRLVCDKAKIKNVYKVV